MDNAHHEALARLDLSCAGAEMALRRLATKYKLTIDELANLVLGRAAPRTEPILAYKIQLERDRAKMGELPAEVSLTFALNLIVDELPSDVRAGVLRCGWPASETKGSSNEPAGKTLEQRRAKVEEEERVRAARAEARKPKPVDPERRAKELAERHRDIPRPDAVSEDPPDA